MLKHHVAATAFCLTHSAAITALPTTAAGTARPFGVARVGGPPSAGALPLVQQRPLKDVTCTHLASCYTDRQQSQRWREARLEEEERRRALRSGGSGSAGGAARAARLPAGMLNLGNTCYMNAVLQVGRVSCLGGRCSSAAAACAGCGCLPAAGPP